MVAREGYCVRLSCGIIVPGCTKTCFRLSPFLDGVPIMNRFSKIISKALHIQSLPLLALLAVNLFIGGLTFQHYGLSWDEPLFYTYADAIDYAYSIPARLSGDFDLERAYGPSAQDHKIYGPAYLLIAKRGVALLTWLAPVRQEDAWRLVNFTSFQAGLIFLYLLARRWAGRWAAFAATFLFSTQPLLWGHAWINPKDIPFTMFFVAAIYLGFRMVDRLAGLPANKSYYEESAEEKESEREGQAPYILNVERLGKLFKGLKVAAVVWSVLSISMLILWAPLEEWVGGLIRDAYQAPPGSVMGDLFARIAPFAGEIPEEAYVDKGLVLLERWKIALVALSAGALSLGTVAAFWPGSARELLQRLGQWLSPLPARPALWVKGDSLLALFRNTCAAGILLGLLASIRVLGPLAGLLVVVYFLLRPERRTWAGIGLYALLAVSVMYVTWPYLWEGMLERFIGVVRHMSGNPHVMSVLFDRVEYASDKLPIRYLPVYLGITLTEPVWPLFLLGLAAGWRRISNRNLDWRSLAPVLLWFLVPFFYVVITRPPMYDGYRHFIFILPPVFLAAGIGFQFLKERLRPVWANLLLALVMAPGLIGLIDTHPYQYAYYNSLVGGMGGAFRRFETDYWLTCYREIMEDLNTQTSEPVTLFVHRQPSIAREYAADHITVKPYDHEDDQTTPGSLLLLSSRTGVDRKYHPDAPVVYSVIKNSAVLCVIKQVR